MSDAAPRGGVGSVFLLDANNFLFRAYHGLPMLNAPDGTPVNAVHGYVRMVTAARREYAPQYIVALFDAKGPGWRHELFPEYKANRPPAPEDLVPQMGLVREATAALSIPWIELEGYEADDLIANYALKAQAAGLRVYILSGDKDLMQLVDDGEEGGRPSIALWDSMKSRLFDEAAVRDKFGVGPDKLGDLLALAGDSVDNVPGVPGIGPKTATTLLEEHGDLEAVLAAAPEIKQKKRRERLIEHAEDARVSRKLVALDTSFELPRALEDMIDPGADAEKMRVFFEPLGFKSTLAGGVSGSTARRSRTGGGRNAVGSLLKPAPEGQWADALKPEGYRCLGADKRDEAEAYIAELRKRPSFGLHIEVSEGPTMAADLIGVALAPAAGVAGLGNSDKPDEQLTPVYLPVAHRSLTDSPDQMFGSEAIVELLSPLLAEGAAPEELRIYCHGHKAQCVVLSELGIEIDKVAVDSMLASFTLDSARTNHEIEGLAEDLLQHKAVLRERVVGKGRKKVGFDEVAVDQAGAYACERAQLALLLGHHLESGIQEAGDKVSELFSDIEMPLAKVLRRIEQRGILVDPAVFKAQSEELEKSIAELRGRIEEVAGYAINPDSPQQLQKLLFEDLELPAKKKTKTGYSTDASVLEELSLLHPVVKDILEHRSVTKLKGTYLDALPALVHPPTGRIHSHFRQAVAQTGRLSSVDPNLQNIPIRTAAGRRIRGGFVAPEGMALVTLDYSQIELRILAHLSKDPSLCGAFRDGADVHARTASEIFEVPEAEVDDEQRRVAKAVNFGVIYGQSAFGLARQLGIRQGKAAKYIKSYFEKIPGVDAYLSELIDRARRTGMAETILGRKRRIPELSARGAAKAHGERIARNTPIQGSAADILKVAMIQVDAALAELGYAQMLLTVHDELIFQCEEDRVDDLTKLVAPMMEGAVELDVPLVVEGGHGRTWEEAKG